MQRTLGIVFLLSFKTLLISDKKMFFTRIMMVLKLNELKLNYFFFSCHLFPLFSPFFKLLA